MNVPITLPVTDDGRKLPAMVGAVIYIRVSTKEQTENLSLPTQLRRVRSTASVRALTSSLDSAKKVRARKAPTARSCRSC